MNSIMTYRNFNGDIVDYYTYGSSDGYPVFYMHGAIPMPFSKPLIDFIQTHNLYVLTVLRPGYGKSTPRKHKTLFDYIQSLKPFIDHFKFKQFDGMGLSAGAPYCYAMAAAYPALVRTVHICAGIPLANNKNIFSMFSSGEKLLFSLSRHIPAGLMGLYGVKAIEAMERKKGWGTPPCGGSMDEIFENCVWPNRKGLGISTRLQYKYWGFDAEKITNKVCIYHSTEDEMIPFKVAHASAKLLQNSHLKVLKDSDHSSEKTVSAALEDIARSNPFITH